MLGGLFGAAPPPPNATQFGQGAYNPFTITKQPESKYKTTSILIEETSNGHIIRIGTVVRICPSDATLFDEVAAAYTESRL